MSQYEKSLKKLIEGLEITDINGSMDVLIDGISIDSRTVREKDLYACVPGFNVDGHDYAPEAVKAGASALLVEKILPLEIPQVKVSNVREMIGQIAARFYDYPASRLNLVGVTGTNGKTTITHLIEKIGIYGNKKVGLIGTMGARINGRDIPGDRTTPEAADVQRLLAEMVSEKVSLAVMEVSSHALDLGRVNGSEFDAAIFTNLTQDHLDYHKTMEEYLKAKARLFESLRGEKKPKISIINNDDNAYAYLKNVSAAPVVSYGINGEADYKARDIKITAGGLSFQIEFRGQRQEIYYKTPGFFSVYNALAAFAWAVETGFEPGIAAKALAEIPGVPGRFESIQLGQPFQVIVDYAHTPDGLENVLRTAREFTQGRVITVFGCGGDRDKGKRPIMGEVASTLSDYVLVTSDNPRTEDPGQILNEILGGVSKVEHNAIEDRKEAIYEAVQKANPGDTVLIAGKGHETYQIIGSAVNPFDDREVAREALRRLGYAHLEK